MKQIRENHEIDSVFILLLFALFAGSILMVLLLGASSYERLVERDQESYNARTGIQYIAAKVRHGDEAGCIQVGSFSERENRKADEIPTLYLRMGTEGEFYYTKIYYYDGYIREMLCLEDSAVSPEAGQEILPAKGLLFSQEGSLLQITFVDEKEEAHSMTLAIRSSQEVSP